MNRNQEMHVRSLIPSIVLLFLTVQIYSCTSTSKKQELQSQADKAPKGPMKVDGYIAQPKSISDQIQLPGSLVAEEKTDIHPEVSGRITAIFIKEGAHVSKGTLLVKLYDRDLQAQKKKYEVQLQINKQISSRHGQLLKIGGISKEDYETTFLTESNTKSELNIVNAAIEKTQIRAPFSGKLGLKLVSPGAYVTPQTVITSIQKTDQLRLDFEVPEIYATRLKLGQQLSFTVAGNSKTYAAMVFATESGIQQNTRSLTIRAKVTGNKEGLIPGGFAKVNLLFNGNPTALMVPTQAVIPQARAKQIILLKNDQANFVTITTGSRDSAMVEVTSGLNKGDTVITTGLMSLKPNMKISIRKIISN
ncbi:MAG: efflux RND transporter periplasmic adaptor subunit [Flavisolibacter sp.]